MWGANIGASLLILARDMMTNSVSTSGFYNRSFDLESQYSSTQLLRLFHLFACMGAGEE